MNRPIFFVNVDIGKGLAGIESSAMLRSVMFNDYLNINAIYLTNYYNSQLHKNKKQYQNSGRMSSAMKVFNMYDFFQETTSADYEDRHVFPAKLAAHRKVPVSNSNDMRFFTKEGDFYAYCKCSDDGAIEHVNYFEDNQIIRREVFDCRGFLSRSELFSFSADGSKITNEIYYRQDGTVALHKRCLISGSDISIQSIYLTDKLGHIITRFLSDEDMLDFWVDALVKTHSNAIFIGDRNKEYYGAIKKANGDDIKIIPIIHSVHTCDGKNIMEAETNHFFRPVLDDPANQDAIIVFTDEQRQDIASRYGEANYHIIPHSHSPVEYNTPFAERKRMKVVYLARYSSEKNHSYALDIFKKVLETMPNAELHLYGFGDEENFIKNYVKENGLSENVFVNPFESDVNKIYQESVLSILTSTCEAFCLSVMESLFNGCPVIALDIKYGPSAMIQDGKSGFLINHDDDFEDKFANKIIEVLTDDELNESFINYAATSMDAYTHSAVAQRWQKLIKSF